MALGSPMGAGLCGEIEEGKEEGSSGEEGCLGSYSQLTDFPKSRRWDESGGERSAFTSWIQSAAPVQRAASDLLLMTDSALCEGNVSEL